MKIGIDLSCLSEYRGGMHRYAFWISHLLKQRYPAKVKLFTFSDFRGRYPAVELHEPLFSRIRSRVFREQVVVPWTASQSVDRLLVPAYLGPAISSVPVDLIVYDFLYLRENSGLSTRQKMYWHGLYKRAIRQASRLFPISRTTSRELKRKFPKQAGKIEKILYPGLPLRSFLSQTLVRNFAERPYLLSVGTVSPRKQFGRLAQALRNHEITSTLDLRVVGEYGWGRPHPSEWEDSTLGITWEKQVSDSELRSLYRGAEALVLPSHEEGFGLPILEAFAHKIPVILRDREIFREVAGDAGFYLSESPEKWADEIKTFLGNKALIHTKITRGYRRSRKFRWANTVNRYLSGLDNFDGETSEVSTGNRR